METSPLPMDHRIIQAILLAFFDKVVRMSPSLRKGKVVKYSRDVFTPFFVLALGIGVACNPALRARSGDSNGSWLKIKLTNNTAVFTVYAPATNANGMFDLYFKTNLTDPPLWTWLQRGAPGQTNLVVSNLPPAQGFFTLGVTNAIRPGFDGSSLPREDDDPSVLASLPFPINFYGANYSSLYVNNNGNVTFGGAQSAFIPGNLTGLGLKTSIIAPYWADVDTDSLLSDVVKYGSSTVDGHNAFGVDWVNVGYFSAHADKLLSCQLVIIDRSDIAAGDFDMEFNYDKVQWQYGDFSSGFPPHAGYAAGVSGYELPGSGVADAFLDSNVTTGLIHHNLNSSVPGRYFFSFRNGQPAP
jgi:hypothetical protein